MNNIISGIVLISLLAPIALPVAPAIRDKISAPYSVGDAATLDDVIAASDAILLCTVTKGGSRVEGEERTLNTIKFLREHEKSAVTDYTAYIIEEWTSGDKTGDPNFGFTLPGGVFGYFSLDFGVIPIEGSDEYYDLYVLPVRRDGDKVVPLTDAGAAVSYFRDMNGNGAIDREDEGTLTPLGGNGFYDGIDDLSALMEILDGKFAGEE